VATIDLCTIADIRTQSEVPTATTTPDSLLTPLITAASRHIMRRYEREFIAEGSGTVTRTFPTRARVVRTTPYDLRATPVTVTLHPEDPSPVVLVSGTDYVLDVSVDVARRRVLRLATGVCIDSAFAQNFGYAQLTVAAPIASWGVFVDTAGVHEDIRRATVITVSSWLDRGIAAYAIQNIDDPGGIRPDTATGWPIPPAAHAIFRAWMDPVV
jgi:hypothetical protein